MPSQATITGKTGPAQTVTSLVLTNLSSFNLQLAGKSVLYTESDQGKKEFDINATTTLTCTIAAGVATIVVSQ
jgi:hypothetical protein